ncbi:MAG: cadherin-like beta sandwich domain-containing protein [Verrucomicrobia bacterium]|nr:cadherin-like beta sandwich domain-containing protein [Verrucomicrobiota bacterium]
MNTQTFRAAIAAVHLFAMPASAAVVDATYNSPSDVPLSAAGYTATGNTVDLALNFTPTVGTCLTVVNNTGTDFIQGTFDNLAQGQVVDLSFAGVTYQFSANYFGGTGNDLVLQWAQTRVLVWGSNSSGQYGNNSLSNMYSPTRMDQGGVLAGKIITAFATGSSHNVMLCADGTVAAAGNNSSGQLGNNSTTSSKTFVLLDTTGVLAGKTVIALATGDSHNLALCADGTLAAWGYNGDGQLGNNSTTNSSVPVLVDKTGVLASKTVIAVAAGNYHNLALCADGTLAAWGKNTYGSLGNNNTTNSLVPVLVDRSGVLADKTVVAISACSNFSLALCADGTLASWGLNSSGQLGNGTTTNSNVPVLVDRSGVLSGKMIATVTPGDHHVLCLCADGTLASWGDCYHGQLGNNTYTNSNVPVAINSMGVLAGKSIVMAAGGVSHSLALCADGTMAAWGYNYAGQLGNNTTTESTVPVAVITSGLGPAERLSGMIACSNCSLALVYSPRSPVAATQAPTGVLDTSATLNASVNAHGYNTAVTFEYGLTTSYGLVVAATPAFLTGGGTVAVATTLNGLLPGYTYHYRVVANNGNATVTGADMSFTTTTFASLAGMTLDGIALSPSFASTCNQYVATVPTATDRIRVTPAALFPDATVQVNGVTVASGAASDPLALAEGNNVITIVVSAAGGGNTQTYTIVVTRLPAVYAFNSPADVPVTAGGVQVAGNTITFALNCALPTGATLTVINNTGRGLISGQFSNLAQGQAVNLSYNKVTYPLVANYYGGSGNDLVLQWAWTKAYAWGYNARGQLGNNSTTTSSVPVAVISSGILAAKSITAMTASSTDSFALCADGVLAGWGMNSSGQLGNGTTTDSKVPTAVTTSGVLAGKTIMRVTAGSDTIHALCNDSTLAYWPATGYVPAILAPGSVLAGKTITAVASGGSHCLILCEDGTLAAYGSNNYGQLGNGSTTSSSVPVAVSTSGILFGKAVIAIAAGTFHSLALCSDGTLASWGANDSSVLGNGTSAFSVTTPVAVVATGVLAGKTVKSIAAGYSHNVVLCADGTLATWGLNSYGQLGNGGSASSNVPVAVTTSGMLSGKTISAIAAGSGYSCALCADGTLTTWGNNVFGQLGTGNTTSSNVPVAVATSSLGPREKFVAVATNPSGNHALAIAAIPLSNNCNLAALGVGSGILDPVFSPGVMTYTLRVAHGTPSVTVTPTVEDATATLTVNGAALASGATSPAISLSPGHSTITIGVTAQDGTTNSYVMNVRDDSSLAGLSLSYGKLLPGFSPFVRSYNACVAISTSTLRVTPTAADATAAITVNGSPVPSGNASAPVNLNLGTNMVTVTVTALDGTTTSYQISVLRPMPVNYAYSAADAVPVDIMGYDATDNTVNLSLGFAPAIGTNLTVIRRADNGIQTGRFSNLAQGQVVTLTYDNHNYAFAANYYGGTGNDLVLQWANNRIYAWGDNYYGQLGVGTTAAGKAPAPVTASGVLAGKSITAIAESVSHSLALCADGTLAAWGLNTSGQLGDGTTANSNTPVAVNTGGVLLGKTVIAIAAGSTYSLALCADGTLAAWGDNSSGQFGDGTVYSSSVPAAVRATGTLVDKSIIAIAAGDSHNLALCADGQVAAWGANTYGQLGDGTTIMREVPVNVVTTGVLAGRAVTAIAAGASHSLALCADGTVVAWGYNNNSQLGNNSATNSSVPVAVNTTGVLAGRIVAAIAAGDSHNLVICTDGTLASWGYNYYGQLGRSTSSLVPGAIDVSGILAGKTVTAITAGFYHSLALCTDGSLAAWGDNSHGQLGNGTTTSSTVPVAVVTSSLGSGEKFAVLARGRSNHTLAVAAAPVSSNSSLVGVTLTPGFLDGAFAPATTSYTARVLHGTTALTVTPVAAASATLTVNGVALASGATSPPVPLSPGNMTLTIQVTAQDGVGTTSYVITVRDDATLAGLTLNAGTLAPPFSPALAGYVNYVPTATAAVTVTPRATDSTAAIMVNGAAVASGAASSPINLVPGSNTVNVTVTALDGTTTAYQVSVIRQVPLSYTYNSATVVPVTAASYTAAGNTADLTLNFMPAAGVSMMVVKLTGNGVIEGTFDNLRQWQTVSLTYNGVSYQFVANYRGGSGNDLVLEWANTRLLAWGYNNNGQLGNNGTTNSSFAVPVDTSGALAGITVVRTATGSSHSLALCADGTLAAWGVNSSHQLGSTSTANSSVPMEVDRSGALSGKTVVAISAGGSHSLALCADGTVVAWGANSYGQLGCGSRGTGTSWSLPVMVDQTGVLAGKFVLAVSAGPNHSLALCTDGTLAAWGYNTNGELGNASGAPSNVPVAVSQSGALAGKSVTAITAGGEHNLVLCADGSLVTWGSNSHYQLGTNSTTTPGVPVAVTTSGVLAGYTVTAIAAGYYHNLVLCSNGTMSAWGYNDYGQLGNNGTSTSTLPVLVTQTGILAGKAVVAISAGSNQGLALCSDGSLAAWGYNTYGALGNNSTTNSSVPVWVTTTMLRTGERFARTDAGRSSGHSVAMVAMSLPPLATTLAASNISNTAATLNGSVNPQGTDATAVFEYGPSASYGTTVVAAPASVSGTAATAVSASFGGLRPGTIYHFRLAATGPSGTIKGADMTFTTTRDAVLSGLTMDGGALYPAFAGNITRYVATVPYAVTSVTLTPVCALADSTVMVNGITVASGSASNPLALTAGNNAITTEVTGAGGATTQTYIITVTRLPQTFTYNSATDTPVTATDFAATGTAPAFALNYAPTPGTTLKVVNNTGLFPVQSAFSNLAQGQAVNLVYNGVIYPFVANYFGGTGNDLVLQWANNRLLGWGNNYDGQLGNTSVSSSIAAVPVDMTGVLAGKAVIALAVGGYHNLALCADNTLAAWGENANGQLGNNSTVTSKTPVSVTHSGLLAGKTITAVAAGGSHSLALCADGTLAAWGSNSYGQLGNHGTAASSVPMPVDLTGVLAGRTVIAIAAGDTTSFALCADGAVAAWGDNTNGRLGNNSPTSSSVPVLVEQTGVLAGKTVMALDAGGTFTLALCTDGTLAAWGQNTYGQLGNNATTHSRVPVPVDRSGVLAGRTVTGIGAGNSHGMVLCSDGKVAAWGYNSIGQLGNNSTTNSSVPVLLTQTGVLSGKTITAIASGTYHNLALCTDGFLAAWGSNNYSQLGVSSISTSSVPVTASGTNLATGEVISAVHAGSLHNQMLVASPPPPAAASLAATTIIDTGATVRGTVNGNGRTTTISFEYGLTSSYGASATATPATATGTTATAASAAISGLLPGTTYHYRIVAASTGGTAKGADMTFTTGTLATLASLTLDGGTLAPAFSGNTTGYLTTVPFTTPSITLTPVVMSSGATVTVAGVPVASGATSAPLSLTVGDTGINLTVTAAGGGYARTYSVTVTRLPQTLTFNTATDAPVTAAGFAAAGSVPPMVLNHVPVTGATLTVVRNTAQSLIAGAFANLAQGQQVWLSYGGITYPYVANYFGGTGNDLVLQWANTRLMGWGYNNYGQLGNTGYANSSVAVPVNMSGVLAGKTVTAIAAGNASNLALCADGTLAAWGYNYHGELGNTSNSNSSVPVAVDMTGVLAGKTVTAITSGNYHHLALCADGTLAAWGYNSSGQLGNNSTTDSSVPVAVNQTGVLAGKTITAIAAGYYHSLALCADGTLAAWGANDAGQLGNTSTTNSKVPALVTQTGVLAGKTIMAITSGGNHNLVLCADGTVASWGYNGYGQLGNNSTTNSSVPVLVTQTGMLAGKTVTAIAAGENHSLVLCANGTMAAWGYNNYGCLGNNSTTNSSVPVMVTQTGVLAGKSVVAIGTGYHHNLAVCADGSMAAWGYDNYGQLGNNSTTQSNVPVMVSTSTMQTGECFMSAKGGYEYSLAMVASPPTPVVETLAATAVGDTGATLNGSVNAQGNSATVTFEYGPTSAYGSTLTATPVSVGGATATAVSATAGGLWAGSTYHYRVVAVGPGGTVRGADMTFTTGTLATLANLTLSNGVLTPAFNSTTMGYLATVPGTVTTLTLTPVATTGSSTVRINGATVPSGSAGSPIPLAVSDNIISIVVTAPDGVNTLAYTVKVTRQPLAYTYNSATDVPLTANGFVASGNVASFVLNHVPVAGTCLTVVNNTGVVPIQGYFDNLTQGQTVPLTYGGQTYAFVANYHGGTGNDLVLQWANIRLLAWGSNGSGQLGNNGASSSSVPGPVDMSGVLAGKTVITVAEGASFNLALCADGTLAAWGANASGQLGNNNTSTIYAPVSVDQAGVLAGKSVAAIAAGDSHCLALCTDGSLAAWGQGDSGQLGNNSTTNSSVPVRVTQTGVLAGKTIIAIAAGSYHNLALCADGTLAAWGRNDYGALGNNRTTAASVPVLVDRSGVLAGKTIIAIAAGGVHSLVLCADGTLAAWGYNGYGQLGIGSTSNRIVPALVTQSGVLAGKQVTAVSCGSNHSLVLCADGTVATWGSNNYGQLGNKGLTSISVPVAVVLTGVLTGKTVAAIASGANHCLALCTDHSLAAWGSNNNSQLGNSSTTDSTEPVMVSTSALGSGENIIAAGGGTNFSLAMVATQEQPVAATLAASGVTDASAVLNGSVDARNTGTGVSFEWGLTASYGITLTGSPASVAGTTPTAVSATVSGLLAGTTYHYRTVATRAGVKVTGGDMTFTTSASATLSNLIVSSGDLAPAFVRTRTVYCATVPDATSHLTVTPVATVPTSTIRVNGVTVSSGTASVPITLAAGDNGISISVTAADGINNQTYTLQVTRMLSAITFNSATDVPMTVSEFAAAGVLPPVVLNHTPLPGSTLTLVNNTGGNPIRGTFDNLRQGQRVPLTFAGVTYLFVASYFGGSGNDLVLQWANTRLLAWGDNSYGQLGDNTTTQRTIPTPVVMSGALACKTVTTAVSGYHHVLALCADGTLAAWGDNWAGQLGNGTTGSSKVPVAVNQSGALAGKLVVKIATSGSHSLALCADGTLAEWGNYYTDQAADHTVPALVDLSGVLAGRMVTAIAVGDNHSLALCSDGTLATWGYNSYGQLGSGLPNSIVPVLVNRTGVLAGKTVTTIAAGAWHNLALCSDGTLTAWGYNNYGQLGNNTTTNSTVPVAVTQSGVLAGKTVTAIAGGGYHSLALCADGTLTSWGYNGSGQLGNNTTTNSSVPVAVTQTGQLSGRTITAISGGGYHSLALCQDGKLATWGSTSNGQLGNGSTGNSNVPVAVSTSAFRNGERLATASAGSIQCLALVASPQSPVVTTLAATDILDTGATLNGSVTTNGMDCTLSFEYGLTPSYGSTVAATPASVSGSAMSTPAHADLGNLIPGTTWHYRFTVTTAGVMTPGEDMTITTSTAATLTNLTLGGGALVPAFTMNHSRYIATVPFVTSAITVTPLATQGTAAITVNGNATPSGTAAGPLSLAVGENAVTIVVTAADGVNTKTYQVAVTRLPASFTFNSATDVPLTTGDFTATGDAPALVLNHAPQTGTRLTIVRCAGNMPIQGVFANLTHGQLVYLTCGGLKYAFVADYHGGSGNDLVLQWANTRLLAWGYNNAGQLGNNSTTNSSIPVPVNSSGVLAGRTVLASAAGNNHGLALCADGSLAAWGDNTYGQLGNNTTTNSSIPVPVDQSGVLAGKRVVAIAAGANHNLALCADGTLAAWGSNDYGELGFGTLKMSVPVLVNQTGVLAGKRIVNIAAGANLSLAHCSDGTVAAWGYNASGQLGNNSTVNSNVPVMVIQTGVLAGTTVTSIAAGGSHNLALCADGTAASWGSNSYGQLGNYSAVNSGVPVRVNLTGVLAGKPVTAMAAGANHSLALCTDGTLVAWGYDNYGQLGNNSLWDSYVPVAVNQSDVLASKTVTAMAAGGGHSLVLCTDGSMAAWGDNTYGQLGNSSTTRSIVPVTVVTDVSGLAAGLRFMMMGGGASHSLALAAMPMPSALSLPATGIAGTGATLNGMVNAAGNDTTVSFEFGPTHAYGSTIAALPSSLAGASDTNVSANLSGLPPGTPFHYRVVAVTNSGVMVNSADMTFTTPSNNALLSALNLNVGTLVPAFGRAVTSYLATVSNATNSVTVTPVTDHPGASVKVNGMPVGSGSASGVLNLAVGANTITTVVTAEDGTTTMSYVIVVNRQPAPDDDSDHDGIPYLVEYAFGLDPLSNSSGQLPQPHMVAKRWEIRFNEPAGVTGITYGAQWSSSLQPGSWTDIPDIGSGTEHVFSVPAETAPKLFMRLKVAQP